MIKIDTTSQIGTYALGHIDTVLISLARKVPLARGYIRKHLGRYLGRSNPVDVAMLGLKIRCYPRENSGDRTLLMSPKKHDHHEKAAILNLAKKKQDDEPFVFVDIGANVGLYTLVIAALLKQCKIFAIEPLPDARRKLVFNVEANNLSNVRILKKAVGKETSTLSLDRRTESLQLRTNGIDEKDLIEVNVEKLSKMLASNDIAWVDALKIDIEGYEDNVLFPFFEEAPAVLWPRLIIIEHVSRNVWQRDCLQLLKEKNYVCEWSGKLNSIYRMKIA